MTAGTRKGKKLGDRLNELAAEILSAAIAASGSAKAEPYLRSCMKEARFKLSSADKWLALADKKARGEE